jgi:hypothetical protein
MLDSSVWPALAIVYSFVVVVTYERSRLGFRRASNLPLPEFVAVTLLAAYPVLGYVVLVARGGMISPRFVLPFCIGVAHHNVSLFRPVLSYSGFGGLNRLNQ